MQKVLLFFCTLFCVSHLRIVAQQYNFAHYSLDAGLSQSEVYDIVQDSRKNIWVATNGGGISRFDGKKFTNFMEQDGLVNDVARAVFEDSKGYIWIATTQGISKYDGQKFVNFGLETKFRKGSFLFSILEDAKGRIIIAPSGNGNATDANFYIIENDKLSTLAEKSKVLSGKAIFNILKGNGKNILINTNTGIYVYDGEQVNSHRLHQITGFKNAPLFALLEDTKKKSWFLHNGLLKFFDGKEVQVLAFPPQYPAPATIVSMIEDSKGNLWFKYADTGVIRYDGANFTHFTSKNGLSGNEIRALYEDKQGNIWIGGNGLLRFAGERFTYFTTQSGLTNDLVMAMYEDSKDIFWVGTGAGINAFEKGKVSQYFANNGEKVGRIKSFAEDEKGNLLVATRAGGILRFDGKQFKNINQELGINFNGFSHILKDQNSYWFSSWGNGVYKIQDQKLSLFRANELPTGAVNEVFKDSKGNFWVATSLGAVVIKNDKIVKTLDAQNGLSHSIVLQFAEDKWGRIWIVTYNGGINIYDGNKAIFLQQKDGLASNTVYFVMKDKQENMWVGTQNGVDKVVLGEKGEVKSIKNYAKAEGFGGVECNGNACYEDKQGNLWFGTINGLYKYNPKEDKPNKEAPTIHFTKLKLFFQSINWADSAYKKFHEGIESWSYLPKNLVLPYDQNHLTFEFEAIDYQTPTKVKYQWKLEGADRDWLPITDKQEATYANLQPNQYRFLLRASNGDGVWTESAAIFAFAIKPPFYQTWWFRTGIIGLIMGLTFTGVQVRLKSLTLQKLKLESQVQERTAEVMRKSEEILLKNVELEQQKEEILTQNDQINQQHRELALAFGEIEQKNKDITASITYAKRIQQAILPLPERISKALPTHFILFKPRDIVSGDFYWFSEIHDQDTSHIVIAVVDCTGHGVPGAFMSLIGNELLVDIVEHRKILQANTILEELHKGVRKALQQEETENRDGMDMTICIINQKEKQMQFAGAKNPIVYIQNNVLNAIKGDRRGIGGYQPEQERIFTNHLIDISEPTLFYLFSDGYPDQFGGEQKRQLNVKRFKEILFEIHGLSLEKQKQQLEERLYKWQGDCKQIDDILVMGIKV